MNGSELLDMMERIDPAFVAEAETASGRKKHSTIRWLAVAAAACLALAVFAGVKLSGGNGASAGLPKLPVEGTGGTFGYEGYLAYSADELVGNSPWDETMELETLPVYKNKYPVNSRGEAKKEQRQKVEFSPTVALPDGLNFGLETASQADLEQVADYLKTAYADEIAMADPVTDVRGGDRNIYGRQMFSLYFYDGTGSVADQLVARDLAGQRWAGDEAGNLWLVWKDTYDLSEKAGDYPILTPGEARAELLAGRYLTSVPYAMPGEGYIAKVDLLYRADRSAKYFMPYYRFLVEVPEAYYGQPQTEEQFGVAVPAPDDIGFDQPVSTPRPQDDGAGMKDYCAYYVPAVRSEYLEPGTLWDGSFN